MKHRSATVRAIALSANGLRVWMRGDHRAFGRAGALWLALLGIAGPLYGQGILTVSPGRTIGAAAGTGVVGYTGDNAAAIVASLANPRGVAYDASGNQYIADAQNHVVREISTAGNITTVAGSGVEGYAGDGGPATAALLDTPTGVAVDASGNLYIADSHNHRIREVSQGTITTLAGNGTPGFSGDGGAPSGAQLSLPTAVAVDAAGTVYIADTNNQRVRAIRGGLIATIAGNGEQLFAGEDVDATAASLDTPTGVAVDAAGNVYIADRHNQRVRVLGSNGHLKTVAGSAPASFNGGYTADNVAASSAALANPTGVAVDAAGNLYIADSGNQRIREVGGGVITTLTGSGQQGSAGEGSTPTSMNLNAPKGVAVNAAGELAISDTLNERVLESSYPQLVFPSTGVGLSATPQPVTLTNSGAVAITVTSSYTGNFATVAGGTCSAPPIQLQAGDNCTVNVAFLPLSVGSLPGSVTFGGVGVVPQSIVLSGAGEQTGTTVSLSSGADAFLLGQPVTFIVKVAATGSVVPTGTVSFYDGGTLLGVAQTLASGAASLTTALSTGTHSITAVYSGDSSFAANSSSALVETIIDFSLAPTGSSGSGGDSGGSGGSVQTVVPGQPATYGFSVQPIGGTTLTFPVVLSATGLPPGATVSFSPQVILVGATGTSFTMTIQTPPPVALLRYVRDGGTISLAGCVLLLPFSGWLRRRGRGGIGLVCLALLSCVSLLGLTGCGAGNGFFGQGPQSYSIQVVGTVSGATTLQHITTVTLMVQ